MCENPIQIDEQTSVSCRTCNQCIGARVNDWVDRAMAEKETMGNALVLALTYADQIDPETGEKQRPLGAKVFDYSDVQKFIKRLRKAYLDYYGEIGEIKYLCCGERGSQHDRVHWHIVLFSKRPLGVLGEWLDAYKKPMEFRTGKSRCHWSLWGTNGDYIGFVSVQEPDAKGMAYALKYCVKDQFNSYRSKMKGRESRSDLFGAGMFRMSKKPPIGQDFIDQRLAHWRALGVVPVSLNLKIKGTSGFWYPRGLLRERLTIGLHLIHEEIREKRGSDSPYWSTLLNSVSHSLEDTERLIYGEIQTPQDDEFNLEHRQQQHKTHQQVAISYEIRKRCGNVLPCEKCQAQLSARAFEVLYSDLARLQRAYREKYPNPRTEFEIFWLEKSRLSRGCQKFNDRTVKRSFAIRRLSDFVRKQSASGYRQDDV